MRTLVSLSTLCLVALALTVARAAEPVKIRHIASLYADNAGIALKNPEGVACAAGTFVAADTANQRLVRFTMDGTAITVAGVHALDKSIVPLTVQITPAGEILVLDGRSRRILRLSSSGEALGVLEPTGVPTPSRLAVRNFRVDAKGNIHLLDLFGQRLLVVDQEGAYLRHLALPGGPGFFSDLAVSGQGETYLLDSVQAQVHWAGPTATAFTPLGRAMKDVMNFPVSIAVDRGGVLYLLDQYGSGLILLGRDGEFAGRKISMGWAESQLLYPAQVCVDAEDNLAIADRDNNRLQLFKIVR